LIWNKNNNARKTLLFVVHHYLLNTGCHPCIENGPCLVHRELHCRFWTTLALSHHIHLTSFLQT
jgi:hypothetical protein